MAVNVISHRSSKSSGYELVAQEPLFDDQAVREYMRVSDNMFLFDCQACAA